ncbi:PAS domain S-box protein [Sediminibacterium sp.]|uniref:PAS domain S-box protein n=1 Tax=Sediminibacterium sp. TaxID=1917865 RepID=UPI002732AA04|nr:PAS domain S-box protein [Sediminibacterium sp.]MDP3394525.1 PAS domain S-box protein [Sediminibacterium sp.]MDP3568360.1 PAS domain S-box protein [Sediminibacterium sp.]
MPNSSNYSSKYETLLAVGQLGGWEYNVLTQELWCNTYYFEMLGRKDHTSADWAKYPIKEVWENWLHPNDLENAKEYFSDFILNPEIEYTQQFRMLHANGEWLTILSRASAMRNAEGVLTGMIIGTHLDITQAQQLSENFSITQIEFEKTKKQVIKDNAFLKAILNSPKDLFVLAIDKHYNFLGFSDSYIPFAKNFLLKEVVVGMSIFDVLPEVMHATAKASYDRALAGESFVVSSNFVTPIGKRLYYENKYSPIIDQHGKILGVTLFSNDITLLKEQLEETRIVDMRYAALFDGAEDAILIADATSGHLVDVNDKACELFGYTKAELIGMHQTKLHPPEDLEMVGELFNQFTKTNSYQSVDVNIFDFEGKRKPVRITACAPFRAGKYLFLAAYFKDLTKERATIEKALTIQEMLSKAEGIAHVGSFEVELPSGFAVWSDEMFRILDLLPNEVVAHTDVFTSMVLPDYLEQYKKWILKESSIEGESKPIEFQIKTPKGNLKHVIVTGVSYKNKAGLIYKFIGVVKDNTARIETMESIKLQNQKLREIAWAQSHLVRGPLSDILGITKIIQDNVANIQEKEMLISQLHNAAQKLDQVIKDVVNNTGSL